MTPLPESPETETLEEALCVCGEIFSEHEKPQNNVPWDICSFPCLKCDCQEFTETGKPTT